MNVLIDIHHHDLFRSLYFLFHRRLGWNVYVPYGMEWNAQYKYANYPSVQTVEQFLTGVKHWINTASDLPNVRFITLDEFKDAKIDIMVASLLENAPVFNRINRELNKNAKLIIQAGNNYPAYIIDSIGKNLMSSSSVVYKSSKIPHKVFYHQEFDLSYFCPPTLQENPRSVFSLQHFFGTGCHPYGKDYALMLKLKDRLPEFDFRCYGAQCEYGIIDNTPAKMSEVVKSAGFIYHIKPQGDGYGHIYHNAYACGKPVIFKSEYLFFNDIPMTPMQLFDEETSVDLSVLNVDAAAEKIQYMANNYARTSANVYRRFKQVSDFDQEFLRLKIFLESLA